MTFPVNPNVNDEVSVGLKTYRWDGEVWARVARTLNANIVTSASIVDNTIALVDINQAVSSLILNKANVADLTSSNVSEGSNLYFTNARVSANVATLGYASNTYINNRLLTKANVIDLNTNNVVEGSNLYFTNTRAVYALSGGNGISIDANGLITGAAQYGDTDAYANTILIGYAANTYLNNRLLTKANVSDLNTNNITEGSNLYFTNTRAISAFTPGTGVGIAANGLITGAVQYSNSDVQLYLGNVTGNIVPSANEVYSLGSSTKKWRDLFLSGNTIVLGETKLESSGDGSLAIKSTNVQVTNQISFASNGYIASTAGPVQAAGAVVPKISNVQVTDSNWNILDDTAVDSQGYVLINGSLFDNGATVVFGSQTASSVTYVSSSQLRVRVPTLSPGNYTVYVSNSDGATATRINLLSVSGFPIWNTSSGNIAATYESLPLSVNVNATSDTTVTYSLYSGSLPTGASLDANTGIISAANVELTSSNVTYNFTLNATDTNFQNTTRSFSATIVSDKVILPNRANNTKIVSVDSTSEYYINAYTLSGRGITITANSLPSGLSIDLANNKISGTPNVVSNVSSLITVTSNITNRSNSYNVFFEIQQSLLTIEFLMIGGGGAGGGTGSGGGAGGLVLSSANIYTGSYPIVIAAGGTSPGNTAQGNNGDNTCAFGFVAYGGGGGVSHGAGPGVPGASGGGASIVTGGSAGIGGLAIYGCQGCMGGNSHVQNYWGGGSGGGGGAGAVGNNSSVPVGGSGGAGRSVSSFSAIGGSPAGCFGGGGGGGAVYGSPAGGGAGGGGSGGWPGGAGAANTGSGGGGGNFQGPSYYSPGGAGGSGLVSIRYPVGCAAICNLTGGTICCTGGYKYHTFTSSSCLVKS